VKEKGNITMDNLKIGDYVRVSPKLYSRVYAFGHYDDSASIMYQQIHAVGFDSPLEISTEHMIYVKNSKGKATLVPAGDLKVGDVLVSDLSDRTQSNEFVIQSIVSVEKTGVYAPFTYDGNILVNGVVASNYLKLMGLPNNIHSWLHAWMSHAATAPRRVICHYNMNWCSGETYNNEGYATWMKPLLNIYECLSYLFKLLPEVLKSVLLYCLVSILGMVRFVEFVLYLPSAIVGTVIVFASLIVIVLKKKQFSAPQKK